MDQADTGKRTAAPQVALQMKQAAGRAAVDSLVKNGMKIGLGTGTTAIHAIRRVGELITQGILKDVYIFATSFQSEMECERLGIPIYPLNSWELAGSLDLTIDGADEVDPQHRLIKGGGGALLIEKVAAYASANYAITVDESKIVDRLGSGFPVPVEMIPQARVSVSKSLEELGAVVRLRESMGKIGPVITEHGNIILDILFPNMVDAVVMEREINQIPGVVENGFFTRKKPVVYIAHLDGTLEIRNPC